MEKLTKAVEREIIDDFAKQINESKTPGAKPQHAVIHFRNEKQDGFEREICYLPLDLLRYRKENGRISSDITSYEKQYEPIDGSSAKSQKIIANFLKEKDPEKTDELLKSIQHSGQDQPAIITCDGFLINGNRRKLVFEMLLEEFPGNEKYKRLKVVILPGKGEPGGPPTKIEIEALENRYQYQSDGKAEYYAFDKAISMRQKIEMGFSLQAQLGDDPRYALLSPSQIKKIVKEYENDLIKPLECIDRYLSSLGRDGLYKTISTGFGDPEGRWQAFYDYSKSTFAKLSDERKRVKLGIKETEVGKIEDASFKIIRKRDLGDRLPKVHEIMREFHKWVENEDAKNELLELSNMKFALNKKDRTDKDGKELNSKDIDKVWGKKFGSEIISKVIKARNLFQHKKERETPLTLLEASLAKLNHAEMDTSSIDFDNIDKAIKITNKIQKRAKGLSAEFFNHKKKLKKLMKK